MTKQEFIQQYVPCTCDIGYTSRKLTDPTCPQCNYAIEEMLDNWVQLLYDKREI